MRVLNGSRLFLRPKQYDHENVFEFSRLLDISVHFIFSVYFTFVTMPLQLAILHFQRVF